MGLRIRTLTLKDDGMLRDRTFETIKVKGYVIALMHEWVRTLTLKDTWIIADVADRTFETKVTVSNTM